MPQPLFTIERRQRAGYPVVHLSGDVDITARESLLREGEDGAGAGLLVFDFSDAEFIDASIIGTLFALVSRARERGGRLLIVDGQIPPRSLWHITRLAEVCPVRDSLPEAGAERVEEPQLRVLDTGCLKLHARMSELVGARRFVEGYTLRAGFSEMARAEITLAVQEAVSNAIRHGSPAGEVDTVEVQVTVEAACLVITVHDHGPGFDPATPSLPDPAEFADHGRGLFLMCHLMDEVRFEREDGMVVRMLKRNRPE